MFAGRRFVLVGMGAAVVWYGLVLFVWALQPLSDSVPVGVDYTLTTPAALSIAVDCKTLFDSAARDDSPLPTLKAQPEGKPALEFQREPCGIVQNHARIIFSVDTVLFAAVVAGFVWLALRWRRGSPGQVGADSNLAGSMSA